MAKESDKKAGALKTEKNTGGRSPGLLAAENESGRRALVRIGAWGIFAVGAVSLAVVSNQSSLGWRHEQTAAADLANEARQIEALAQENRNETRRLAAAVETLNNDRDRLFSRVTVIEQGLDSVTGALAVRQTPPPVRASSSAPEPQASATPSTSAQPGPQNAATAAPPPVAAPAITLATALPAVEKPRADAGKPDASPTATTTASAPANSPASNPPVAPSPSAASPMAKAMTGPANPAAPKPTELAKPTDAKPVDAKPVDAKAADPKAADKKAVDAKEADAAAPPAASPSPEQIASALPDDSEDHDAAAVKVSVQRTDFAVDLGSANSIGGLRALWRGLLHSHAELADLNPIIIVKESNTGLGMQLHLAAGPLNDAAAAATICAALAAGHRTCETTVFDGQRLSLKADDKRPVPGPKLPAGPKAAFAKAAPKLAKKDEPPPAKPESSGFSLFKRNN